MQQSVPLPTKKTNKILSIRSFFSFANATQLIQWEYHLKTLALHYMKRQSILNIRLRSRKENKKQQNEMLMNMDYVKTVDPRH